MGSTVMRRIGRGAENLRDATTSAAIRGCKRRGRRIDAMPAHDPTRTSQQRHAVVVLAHVVIEGHRNRQGRINLPIAFSSVDLDRVIDLAHMLFAHAVAVHDEPRQRRRNFLHVASAQLDAMRPKVFEQMRFVTRARDRNDVGSLR